MEAKTNNKNYVISVGAGKNQIPVIKRAIGRGYNIISFDKDCNAPGKQFSYLFKNISTWDYEDAIEWLDSLDLDFKGALCFSYGKALTSQQRIIARYNMKCKINNNFVYIMEDKGYQRKVLKELNLSTLKEYDTFGDTMKESEHKLFIIKDKIGGSSNNIHLIKNDIHGYKNVERLSFGDYIIQEYLEGIEYRVICLVKSGVVKFMSIMERNNLRETFLTGRLKPQNNIDEEITFFINRIIEKFEIRDSAIKIDIIKKDNRIEILEIDFGIGGDYFETAISPICYNYDFIDNYLNLMMDLPVDKKMDSVNEFCFDYVYNISKTESMSVNYKKIIEIANKNFSEYKLIKVHLEGDKVQYPQSNMDAVFGIIHNRGDLSNHDINILFNETSNSGGVEQ